MIIHQVNLTSNRHSHQFCAFFNKGIKLTLKNGDGWSYGLSQESVKSKFKLELIYDNYAS